MENKDKQWFAFIGIFIAAILLKIFFEFLKLKKTKQDLANDYGVCKNTASNWAEHFQDEIPIDEYKKKKKLSMSEIISLKNKWGRDMEYVLNKKQIAKEIDTDYKTLGECVILKLNEIGITKEAWKQNSKFPPNISLRIISAIK